MSLSQQVHRDLQQAMKQGDKVRLSTLRLLHAAIRNREIARGDLLDDSEALEVVLHAAKQRREAIALARDHARDDVARQEARELAILEEYLPTPLNADELAQRIDAVIEALGADSVQDLGRVMQRLMPGLKGRADGHAVSRLVRERLA